MDGKIETVFILLLMPFQSKVNKRRQRVFDKINSWILLYADCTY